MPSESYAISRGSSLWAVALATAVFALVPLAFTLAFTPAFTPGALHLNPRPAFFWPKYELLMVLSAMLLVVVAGAALSGAKLTQVPVLLPTLSFLGVSTVSTLFSRDVFQSLVGQTNRHDGLHSLAAGVLVFYAAALFLDSWAKVRVFLMAGVTSAVLIAVYGILQHFELDPVLNLRIPWYTMKPVSGPLSSLYLPTGRVFSTLGQPIFLAAYLTLMMGAALALYFRTQSRWERGVWLAALAVMGACWLYTYTRGAMLGLGVALPVVLWLAYTRIGSVRPLLLPIAVLAVSILAAQLLSPQATNVIGRFSGTNLAPTLEEIPEGGDLSVTTRLLMWRDTVPVILERPLLGHGPDRYAEPFARHEGEDLRAFFPNGETIDKAHNELLQVAATTGLLGLAAYLWVLVSYFRNAYRSGGWPLLALSGGVLAYILQLQTAFTTIATGITFWAILGVSVAVMRLQEREDAKEGSNPSTSGGPEATLGRTA